MNFKWDNTKNKTNIKKHGIDFSDAVQMFYYPLLTCIDRRKDYNEERWVGIGILKGIIAVIVYTEDDMNEVIRIISVRRATSHESKKYKENIKY
ncbi:MAG: BrnT family toxin [Chitinispirillaceae bacterium]|nr:BrnT family toxin [Chitinispirillaceae bacterium]